MLRSAIPAAALAVACSRPPTATATAPPPLPQLECPAGTTHTRAIEVDDHTRVCGEVLAWTHGDVILVCQDARGVQTGPIVALRDGRRLFEGHCVRDVKDGRWTSYFRDGRLRSESDFRNGSAEGMVRMFHPNGRLQIEAEMRQNQVVWKREYAPDGTLVREQRFDRR